LVAPVKIKQFGQNESPTIQKADFLAFVPTKAKAIELRGQ
jgi:hypothetical protein